MGNFGGIFNARMKGHPLIRRALSSISDDEEKKT